MLHRVRSLGVSLLGAVMCLAAPLLGQSPGPAPPPLVLTCIDDRGDIPGAAGLAATLRWPADLNVRTGRVRMVYEWRPPGAAPLEAQLADQLQPDHLRGFTDGFPGWLAAYCPDPDYDGYLIFDIERWPSFASDASDDARAAAARQHPSRTYAELWAMLVDAGTGRARQLRPRLAGIGFYGYGTANPGNFIWKPGYTDDHVRQAARDAPFLRAAEVPCPVFYFDGCLTAAADRVTATVRQNTVVLAGFGPKAPEAALALVNLRGVPSCPERGEPLGMEAFRENLRTLTLLGYRRFVLWDAIDSVPTRDKDQAWIDGTAAPVLRDLGFVKVALAEPMKPASAPAPSVKPVAASPPK